MESIHTIQIDSLPSLSENYLKLLVESQYKVQVDDVQINQQEHRAIIRLAGDLQVNLDPLIVEDQRCPVFVLDQTFIDKTVDALSVLVAGLEKKFREDDLRRYFTNTFLTGGHDVINIFMANDGETAVITFKQACMVKEVLSRNHTVNGRDVKIEAFYPVFGMCPYYYEPSRPWDEAPKPFTITAKHPFAVTYLLTDATGKDELTALKRHLGFQIKVSERPDSQLCVEYDSQAGGKLDKKSWETETRAALEDLLGRIVCETVPTTTECFDAVLERAKSIIAELKGISFQARKSENCLVFTGWKDSVESLINELEMGEKEIAKSPGIMELLQRKIVQSHVRSKFREAEVFVEMVIERSKILLRGTHSKIESAEAMLDEAFKTGEIFLPPDCIQSQKYELEQELTDEMTLIIDDDRNDRFRFVTLAEKDDAVAEKIHHLFSLFKLSECQIDVDDVKRDLITKFREDKLEDIRQRFTVKIRDNEYGFVIEGYKKSLHKAAVELKALVGEVLRIEYSDSKPGFSRFLCSEKGKTLLDEAQRKHKVIYKERDAVLCTFHPEAHCSNPVIKVERGDITTKKVDAIVSFVDGNLKPINDEAAAVHKKSGKVMDETCKEYLRLQRSRLNGEVLTLLADNLPCKSLFLAVCDGLKDDKQRISEELYEAIYNCLVKMEKAGSETVAFPCVGSRIWPLSRSETASTICEAFVDFIKKGTSIREVRFISGMQDGAELFLRRIRRCLSGYRDVTEDDVTEYEIYGTHRRELYEAMKTLDKIKTDNILRHVFKSHEHEEIAKLTPEIEKHILRLKYDHPVSIKIRHGCRIHDIEVQGYPDDYTLSIVKITNILCQMRNVLFHQSERRLSSMEIQTQASLPEAREGHHLEQETGYY